MATRIELKVKMDYIHEFTAKAYGYGYETRYIYKMIADDGKVYVWKTTAFMVYEVGDDFYRINKGDVIRIKATVKGESEYRGEKQTELTRVKVVAREFAAETYEEMMARKEKEKADRIKAQYDSLTGEDFVWKMPYRQFKEHYSDCETIEDSFERLMRGVPTIKVIIREGRLKESGVRGRSYSYYTFKIKENGEEFNDTFKAIHEFTALRQARKLHANATEIELMTVSR